MEFIEARRGGRGGAHSFVACLSHLIIDHSSHSRRSTVPTPTRDSSNIWTLSTAFHALHMRWRAGGGTHLLLALVI